MVDVEVLARKFLSQSEYKMFRTIYIENQGETGFLRLDELPKLQLIHLKLGRTFDEQGLWPVTAYFRPQDLRRATNGHI